MVLSQLHAIKSVAASPPLKRHNVPIKKAFLMNTLIYGCEVFFVLSQIGFTVTASCHQLLLSMTFI